MIKNYKKYITESKEDDKIYLDITDMVKDYLDMFILAIQENEYDEVPNWITKNNNFIKLLKKDIIKTIEYTLDTNWSNIAEVIEAESVFNEYKKTYPEEYSKNSARKKFNI